MYGPSAAISLLDVQKFSFCELQQAWRAFQMQADTMAVTLLTVSNVREELRGGVEECAGLSGHERSPCVMSHDDIMS